MICDVKTYCNADDTDTEIHASRTRSIESTPLRADWPTTIPSHAHFQQTDQSQDAQLSRDSTLPGNRDADAGHMSSVSKQLMTTRESICSERVEVLTDTTTIQQQQAVSTVPGPVSECLVVSTSDCSHQLVQQITDQVVMVGQTAEFECRLQHCTASCHLAWSVFSHFLCFFDILKMFLDFIRVYCTVWLWFVCFSFVLSV